MKWKVGQTVVCARRGTLFADCYIRTVDLHENVTIVCPAKNTVISGQRLVLERLGWRIK